MGSFDRDDNFSYYTECSTSQHENLVKVSVVISLHYQKARIVLAREGDKGII
jgi:hypothetical protein